ANPSQAVAAVNNGPDPAPPNINAELISGGKKIKAGIITSPTNRPRQRLLQPHVTRHPAATATCPAPGLDPKAIARRKPGLYPNLIPKLGGMGARIFYAGYQTPVRTTGQII